jgi:hypothetical protein
MRTEIRRRGLFFAGVQVIFGETGHVVVIEFLGIPVFVIQFMYDGGICNRFFDK